MSCGVVSQGMGRTNREVSYRCAGWVWGRSGGGSWRLEVNWGRGIRNRLGLVEALARVRVMSTTWMRSVFVRSMELRLMRWRLVIACFRKSVDSCCSQEVAFRWALPYLFDRDRSKNPFVWNKVKGFLSYIGDWVESLILKCLGVSYFGVEIYGGPSKASI